MPPAGRFCESHNLRPGDYIIFYLDIKGNLVRHVNLPFQVIAFYVQARSLHNHTTQPHHGLMDIDAIIIKGATIGKQYCSLH